MHGFSKLGCVLLHNEKPKLICCNVQYCCNQLVNISATEQIFAKSSVIATSQKEKHEKFRRCSFSEPSLCNVVWNHLTNLPALNPLKMLDTKQLANLHTNYKEELHQSSPDSSTFTFRGDQPKRDQKCLVINVFLNDKQITLDGNSINICIKDLDPKNISVGKLTQSIQDNYQLINKICQGDLNNEISKSFFTKNFEKLWREVIKNSAITRGKSSGSPLTEAQSTNPEEDKEDVEELKSLVNHMKFIAKNEESAIFKESDGNRIQPQKIKETEVNENLSEMNSISILDKSEDEFQKFENNRKENMANALDSSMEESDSYKNQEKEVILDEKGNKILNPELTNKLKDVVHVKLNANSLNIEEENEDIEEKSEEKKNSQKKIDSSPVSRLPRPVKKTQNQVYMKTPKVKQNKEKMDASLHKVKQTKKLESTLRFAANQMTTHKNEDFITAPLKKYKDLKENIKKSNNVEKVKSNEYPSNIAKEENVKKSKDVVKSSEKETAQNLIYMKKVKKKQNKEKKDGDLHNENKSNIMPMVGSSQLSKYKTQEKIQEKMKPENRHVTSMYKSKESASKTVPIKRPISRRTRERLQHLNQKTQERIHNVIKLASTPKPQNTITKVVSFCKGLFLEENQLAETKEETLTEDFVDRTNRGKKLSMGSNPYTMQYRNFLPPTRSDFKMTEMRSKRQEYLIGSMLESEKLFQQKCGVRERILTCSEAKVFKQGKACCATQAAACNRKGEENHQNVLQQKCGVRERNSLSAKPAVFKQAKASYATPVSSYSFGRAENRQNVFQEMLLSEAAKVSKQGKASCTGRTPYAVPETSQVKTQYQYSQTTKINQRTNNDGKAKNFLPSQRSLFKKNCVNVQQKRQYTSNDCGDKKSSCKAQGKHAKTKDCPKTSCNTESRADDVCESKDGSDKDKKADHTDSCDTAFRAGDVCESKTEDKSTGICIKDKSRSADSDDKEEVCPPTNYKCETEEECEKLAKGILGATSKCLANRNPDVQATPQKIQESDAKRSEEGDEHAVKPEVPNFDIMDSIGHLVNNDPDGAAQRYFGDNGYKTTEYYKYHPCTFHDIYRHLADKRNPQPGPHKKPEKDEEEEDHGDHGKKGDEDKDNKCGGDKGIKCICK